MENSYKVDTLHIKVCKTCGIRIQSFVKKNAFLITVHRATQSGLNVFQNTGAESSDCAKKPAQVTKHKTVKPIKFSIEW
jgi:hypothetical protein